MSLFNRRSYYRRSLRNRRFPPPVLVGPPPLIRHVAPPVVVGVSPVVVTHPLPAVVAPPLMQTHSSFLVGPPTICQNSFYGETVVHREPWVPLTGSFSVRTTTVGPSYCPLI